jgi:glycine hydroxymethyltransferase
VPNDPQSPFVTSGIRVGTPAITTRGFGIDECQQVATMVCDVLDHLGDAGVEKQVSERVMDLCRRFPVPA